ncbi:MAG: hypothetical protein AAB512_05175 [Patescibacteria group bacterium]
MSADRKINFRRASFTAPILFAAAWASGCANSDQPTGEALGVAVAPTTTNPEILAPEPTKAPVIPTQQYITLKDGTRLVAQMTIDRLTNPTTIKTLATIIPKQSLDDITSLLAAAKNAQVSNPDNPEIKKLVRSSANIAKIHCGNEDVDNYMQLIASWGYQFDRPAFDANPTAYTGGCTWGKTPEQQAKKPDTKATIATETALPENPTPKIDKNGNLVINENGYTYTIYKDMNLTKLASYDLEGYLGRYIGQQVSTDIKSSFEKARQKELANPQDPAIIIDVNSAANLLNVHCNNNVYARSVMGWLASYVYLERPQDWPTNKSRYLDGACFWGERKSNIITMEELAPFIIPKAA